MWPVCGHKTLPNKVAGVKQLVCVELVIQESRPSYSKLFFIAMCKYSDKINVVRACESLLSRRPGLCVSGLQQH